MSPFDNATSEPPPSVNLSTETPKRGGRPRQEPTQVVGVRIPVSEHAAMTAYATAHGMSVAELFRLGWTHLQLTQAIHEQGASE